MSRRDLFTLYVLSLAASAWVGTRGLAYWDAGDYARLAVEGRMSGLLLGRPLFLLVSRAILGLGFDLSHAEPVLRWSWTLVSAFAAPLLAVLGVELGLSRQGALASGAALALSPSFAHTAHQVLTDGPALTLTIGALALVARPGPQARSRAVAAGLVLAAAIATRETAVLFGLSLMMLAARAGRRSAVLAVMTTVLGTALIVLAAHRGLPPSLLGWGKAMGKSSRLGVRDVLSALGWVLSIGPVPVLVGLASLRCRMSRELQLVVVPAAIATALLLLYPFAAWTPRFMVATVPLAFLLPAGPLLARQPRWTALALLVPLLGAFVVTERARAVSRRGDDAAARFGSAPDRSLIVPGHFCPQVQLAIAIDVRKRGVVRDVTMLCPGWQWPEDPIRALDDARCHGRTLMLDVREDAWIGEWEVAPSAAIRAYARREGVEGPIAMARPRTCTN